MGTIVIFFLLVIIAALFIGASFILRLAGLFTKGPGASNRRSFNDRNNRNNRNNNSENNHNSADNAKIFGKDEGEYVDFEEIK